MSREDVDAAKAQIKSRFDVSRETIEALDAYASEVERWTKSINLVSKADSQRIWSRHILDSAALFGCVRPGTVWYDVGSGGGLPIVPLAIYAKGLGSDTTFVAVEPDGRKAAFLTVIASKLALPLRVIAKRIQDVEKARAEVISARGCTSIREFLQMLADSQVRANEIVLLKGARVKEELTTAAKSWHMRYQQEGHTFETGGHILVIDGRFSVA